MKGPVIYYPIAEMYANLDGRIETIKTAKDLFDSIQEDLSADLNVELDFAGIKSIKPLWIKRGIGQISPEIRNKHIRILNMNSALKKNLKKLLGDTDQLEAAT